jgi:hypothetical protein
MKNLLILLVPDLCCTIWLSSSWPVLEQLNVLLIMCGDHPFPLIVGVFFIFVSVMFITDLLHYLSKNCTPHTIVTFKFIIVLRSLGPLSLNRGCFYYYYYYYYY